MFTTCSGGIVPAATRERGACYSYPDIESQKAHQDPEAAAPQASEHEHGGCEALTQKSRGARDSAASLFGSSKKRPSALEDTILAHVPGEPDEDEKPTPRSSAGGTWRDASSSSFSSTVTDDSSMSSLMQGHYCTQLTQSTARDQNGVHGGPGAASLQDPRPAGVVHTATLPSTSAPQTIEGRLGKTEHLANPCVCPSAVLLHPDELHQVPKHSRPTTPDPPCRVCVTVTVCRNGAHCSAAHVCPGAHHRGDGLLFGPCCRWKPHPLHD